MLCLWSTRPGIGAALIRARDGGTASHCAILLPAYGDSVDSQTRVLDAQPWRGVQPSPLDDWLRVHTLLAAYDVPLIDERAGLAAALSMIGWGYDWMRNIGYGVWRDLGRSKQANCEEMMLLAWMAGGRTISDRTGRISVRTLREIAHACGAQISRDELVTM